MLKVLLVAVVVVLAVLWLLKGRGRGTDDADRDSPTRGKKPNAASAEPARMLACAHCGVHLPQPDALLDAGGRPFCSDAHRLAGPR